MVELSLCIIATVLSLILVAIANVGQELSRIANALERKE